MILLAETLQPNLLNTCLLILAGFAAGVVNTLAGSGSVFTLSTLIFFGLPANIANGSNRVGTSLQALVAVLVFRKSDKSIFKWSAPFVIPAILGSLLGAQAAIDLSEEVLNWVIGGIMIFLLMLILFNPRRGLKEVVEASTKQNPWLIWPLFFAIGFYGGFIQAGIGILLLVSLVSVAKFTMVKANAVKLVIVLAYSIPVFFIYVYNEQIDWVAGGLLAVGQLTGSFLAARFAVRNTQANRWIRRLLIIMICMTILKLFGVLDVAYGWLQG
ncbi:MAG: sulfite exporter TauE/SafE family protein [Flammeovirgaceae bacterium]